jgi:speckle-type POZ protein
MFGKFPSASHLLTADFSLLQVSVISDSQNVSGQTSATQFKIPDCRLADDLSSLLDDGSFTDVILVTPNREFKAHKSILACT